MALTWPCSPVKFVPEIQELVIQAVKLDSNVIWNAAEHCLRQKHGILASNGDIFPDEPSTAPRKKKKRPGGVVAEHEHDEYLKRPANSVGSVNSDIPTTCTVPTPFCWLQQRRSTGLYLVDERPIRSYINSSRREDRRRIFGRMLNESREYDHTIVREGDTAVYSDHVCLCCVRREECAASAMASPQVPFRSICIHVPGQHYLKTPLPVSLSPKPDTLRDLSPPTQCIAGSDKDTV